jgi:predicted phosphodiesterase
MSDRAPLDSLQAYREEVEALLRAIGPGAAGVELAQRLERLIRFELERAIPHAECFTQRLSRPAAPRPGRTALISDIHGNHAGLLAVLDDITRQRCDRIVCLGDLVEGGPENERVIQTLQELGVPCVRGNHDETNDVTLPSAMRRFLLDLPERFDEDDVMFTHISPRARKRKIDHAVEAWNVFDEHAFRLLFIGHVHVPMIFGQRSDTYGESAPHAFEYNRPFALAPDERYIVSVGSVAYGRDYVSRIRYGIHDSVAGTVELRAIEGPLLPMDYALRLAATDAH